MTDYGNLPLAPAFSFPPPSKSQSEAGVVARPAPLPPLKDHCQVIKPRIKSVSVPHHSKSPSGKWIYACRVVPEQVEAGSVTAAGPGANFLGRMTLAGTHEPHTVWRTWSEFIEFSARLSDAFSSSNPSSPHKTASPGSPASPVTALPKLNRKFSLVVTKNTVLTRQEELDLFVHRLFQLPPHVTDCDLVRDFFRMRGQQEQPAWSGLVPSPEDFDGPESFGHFLSNVKPGQATLSAASSSSVRRPGLAMKSSTPDLRKLLVTETHSSPLRPEFGVRSMSSQAVERSSSCSNTSGSSSSSSATITPANAAKAKASLSATRMPSPLAQQYLHSSNDAPTPSATTPRSPNLRHFQSLQDLRGPQPGQLLSLNSPAPITRPAGAAMQRSVTSPMPTSPDAVQTDVEGAILGQTTTRPVNRRASSKSSISSFDDVSNASQQFHVLPSGRIDRGSDARLRRPSLPSRNNSSRSMGHAHTPSSSSIESTRSSFEMTRTQSGASSKSRGSSTDYSDSYPVTPPTPYIGRMPSSENIKQTQPWLNNSLPPAPFFPLPPSSTSLQAAFSLDGTSHPLLPRHRRKSSSDSRASARSRAGSILSQRSPLDLIPGSPCQPESGARYEPSPLVQTSNATSPPTPSDKLIIKVLHPTSNFLVRVARDATFEQTKEQIENKFRACGISLAPVADDQHDDSGVFTSASEENCEAIKPSWQLAFTPSKQAIEQGATSYVLESSVEYEHCVAANANVDKITLRVIC